ncbi:DDE-type integrase/transposase/recombinase [Vogesella urethralis]|uniref:DDE-type integrase/transposase/recombinase n=1 Tax=Vogesella urethralis TaxID=2592656 RepID=UPI0011864AED|nr:DDE-type integrase/transposase/recombinase [Vogesella urethralis]
MKRANLRKGLVFVENLKRWTLLKKTVHGLYQLESLDGEIRNMSEKELLEGWRSGVLVIDEASLGQTGDLLYTASPKTLSMFSERARQGALRKKTYLDALDPANNPYQKDSWASVIAQTAEKIGDPHPPGASTVHRWWSIYRQSKCVTKLVKRRPRQLKRDPRIEIFEAVVAEKYLNRQKVFKITIAQEVCRRIDRLNETLPAVAQLSHPSKATVYRWLDALQQDVIDQGRLSGDAVRIKHRSVTGTIKVDQILDRVEIDHTPIDLIVIDTWTGLVLGRPWLTIVLDRKSRMVLGFYLTFNPPSTTSVLMALRHAMLSKDGWVAQFDMVNGHWPCYGIPLLIAVDNGMEFHSAGLEEACLELGIDLLLCPAKEPFYKGAVERFFRTLNSGLIHKLPGTTFSNPDMRGDYPSEDMAVIDLPTLNALVTKWIVDVYAITPHRGLNGQTPISVWMDGLKVISPSLPAFPVELDTIVGLPAKRTLFHYGLELEGLTYNNRALQQLRLRAGYPIKIELRFYDHSVEFVDVYDAQAEEFIRVPAVNEDYTKGLTRHLHRLISAESKRRYGSDPTQSQRLQARHEIELEVAKALKGKKMGLRKKAYQVLMNGGDRPPQGRETAFDIARESLSPWTSPAEALPDGLEDDLPDFGATGDLPEDPQ